MNKILPYLKILRPLNIILCAFSVIISAWLINNIFSPIIPFTIIIVISFAGAANILNDILDINIDKINHPNRVLVSGKIKMMSAVIYTILLLIIGIYFCQYIQPLGKYIAFFIVLPSLLSYTSIFKKIPFIGNLVVGLMLGSVFLFTESAIEGQISKMWTPFYLATLLSIIREVVKDAADIKGDQANNISTFPKKFGLIPTLWLVRFLIIILFLSSIIPWINGFYNNFYLFLLIVNVIIPSFYIIFIQLDEKSTFADYIHAAKLFKIITFGGMIVIFSTGLS